MADRDLTHLCPALQRLVPVFVQKCLENGITVKIIVTYRDSATQNAVKKLGLSNAKAGQSPHNCIDAQGRPYSKAFDFGVFDGSKYIVNGSDARYAAAGAIGVSLGLVYGGNWKSMQDMDHLELAQWRTIPYVSS